MTLTEALKKEAFKKFLEWKAALPYDLGDTSEDWGDWWECFLAGYEAAQDA